MTSITISLKRASDIRFQDVIRVKPKGDWQFVYDAAQDGDYPPDTDEARVVTNELDGRYVLLRLATDPDMSIDDRYDHTLHAWLANGPGGLPRGDWAGGRPKHFGLPSEPTSEYVVLRQYDLVEVQTLVQTDPLPEDSVVPPVPASTEDIAVVITYEGLDGVQTDTKVPFASLVGAEAFCQAVTAGPVTAEVEQDGVRWIG